MDANAELSKLYDTLSAEGSNRMAAENIRPETVGEYKSAMRQASDGINLTLSSNENFVRTAPDVAKVAQEMLWEINQAEQKKTSLVNRAAWMRGALIFGVLVVVIILVIVGVLMGTGVIKVSTFVNPVPSNLGGLATGRTPWSVWPTWQTMDGISLDNDFAHTGSHTAIAPSYDLPPMDGEMVSTGFRGQSYITPFASVENPNLNRWYKYKTNG
jgi:hypothetical protein